MKKIELKFKLTFNSKIYFQNLFEGSFLTQAFFGHEEGTKNQQRQVIHR